MEHERSVVRGFRFYSDLSAIFVAQDPIYEVATAICFCSPRLATTDFHHWEINYTFSANTHHFTVQM